MFASSMVFGSNSSSDSPYQAPDAPTTISDSIMVLLEPLMLCSGVSYTMRYFLNEIAKNIPELKFTIHENLLKILSQILTGKPMHVILAAISAAAQNLIRSNNFYSLISTTSIPTQTNIFNKNLTLTSLNNGHLQMAVQQQHQQQTIINDDAPSPQTDIESLVQALQTLRAFEFSIIFIIGLLRYCIEFYLQHESRLVKIETVITTSALLAKLINTISNQDSRSLISIISCALRKLLICAITDYEPDVR